MKRKIIICLSVLLALFLASMSCAADYRTEGTIKVGHTEKATDVFEDQYMAYTSVFKDAVERNTSGRFKVTAFPNSQLGDNRSMMEQCQRGLLQIQLTISCGFLAAYDPRFALFELPYIFKDGDHITRMFQTEYALEMIETLAQKNGIRIIGVLPAGMRCFSNNVRPISSPADMKGLKIRSMEIPIYMKMIEALGASPTPIPWAELYTSCQTGIVDGQENAPQTFVLAGFHEVQKYLTLDYHTGNTMMIIMNEKYFQSLSPDDQLVIRRATRDAIKAFLGILMLKETRDMNILAEKMEITPLTTAQIEEFKNTALPPCLAYMEGEVGKEELDKFMAAVEESSKEF